AQHVPWIRHRRAPGRRRVRGAGAPAQRARPRNALLSPARSPAGFQCVRAAVVCGGPQHRRDARRRGNRSGSRRIHRPRRRGHVPGEARGERPQFLTAPGVERWRYSPPMPLHASPDTDPAVWLDQLAERDRDRVFLATPDGQRVTYAAMNQRVDGIAAALMQRAVTAGDRVVAQVEKSPDAIALYLACLRVGAVFVPLNTQYTSAEVDYFLGDADPKLAVGVERGGVTLTDLTREHSGSARMRTDMRQADLAALLYTSGTTGRSKGAMLTRANLATNAIMLAQEWRFTGRDVLLHALPIFHVHGLFVAINTVLAAGSSMLFLPKFDADEVIRL